MPFSTTSLMLNADGSVYHLHAFPEDVAPLVILVGDLNRVPSVSQHFDRIDIKRAYREFMLHTGWLGHKRVTVIGAGIGSDNIDIVMNELDAVVNIDFARRVLKSKLTELTIIRLGTAGALHAETPLDSLVLSTYAFSFDGLLNYYKHQYTAPEKALADALSQHFHEFRTHTNLCLSAGSPRLIEKFRSIATPGITFTCCGFYGPQHRELRAPIIEKNILKQSTEFQHEGQRIVNFEMESAAIYGLGKILNHACCSISMIVANRINEEKSMDPESGVNIMIEKVLSML